MTVWISSQPTRSQLLSKGFARLVGSHVGVIAGVAIVLAAGTNEWLIVLGLAICIAICVGVGNLLRGFPSYRAVLAGYSAAMVALLSSDRPQDVISLGADRMATVVRRSIE